MTHSRLASYTALVGFAVLSAARDVWAKSLFKADAVDPVTITWFACCVTFVLFYLTRSFQTRRPYAFEDFRKGDRTTRQYMLFLNIGTLIAFVTTFLAIDRLDAYRNSLIDYGFSPFVVAMLAVVVRGERISPMSLGGMLMSMMGIAVLAARSSARHAEHGADTILGMSVGEWLGLVLAGTSAVAMAFVLIWSKKLVERRITRERILLTRLPLAIVSLPIVWLLRPFSMPGVDVVTLVSWSVVGISIPLLLIVYAFERLNVKNVAPAFFLIPPFTFVGSLIRGHFQNESVVLYAIAGAVVIAGVWVAERGDSAAPNNGSIPSPTSEPVRPPGGV